MGTVILDGSTADDLLGERIRSALLDQLAALRHDAQSFTFGEKRPGGTGQRFEDVP